MNEMKNLYDQMMIFKWNIKNNKWIFLVCMSLFVCFLPVMAFIFRVGTDTDAELAYSYTMYLTKTILSVLGYLPFLMTLHGVLHHNIRDCIILTPNWREHVQFLLHFAVSAMALTLAVMLIAFQFHGIVSNLELFGNYVEYLVVLWLLYAMSHFIAKLFHNAYVSLIILEMYGILCWFMLTGFEHIWNVYGIESLEGMVWRLRIAVYIFAGILVETYLYIVYTRKLRKIRGT